MSNPIDVKWFTSAMAGAPVISGAPGALIAVLDACLINGFGSVTLLSLTISGGVATATKTGHGFLDHVVLLIEGATPSELNGEKRITLVNANTFTFDATGISDQTATGIITAKMAPLGWEKIYSGVNKAVYGRSDQTSTAMVLRVDDTGTTSATVCGYEEMSDVDTGIGAFAYSPAYFLKSPFEDTVSRVWELIGDSKLFYYFATRNSRNYLTSFHAFGDFIKILDGDSYNCLLHPETSLSYNAAPDLDVGLSTTNSKICRSYTQVGTSIPMLRSSHRTTSACGYGGSIDYPSPVGLSLHIAPIEIWESTSIPRGFYPGAWNPLHTSNTIPHHAIINGGPSLNGHKLMNINLAYYNGYATYYRSVAMDITGPWR